MQKIIVNQILKRIEFIEFIGNKKSEIHRMIELDPKNSDLNVIFWCSDKNLNKLKFVNAGSVIVSNRVDKSVFKKSCNYIIVDNPRNTFREILEKFFIEKPEFKICNSASVHKNVKLGKNVFIGENVVVEEDVEIGNNVIIQHNTVIFKNTKIGDYVVIGANNTIGGVGFGYEKDKNGDFQLIPHIGNVIIKDNVEIGNNTCIDKAVLGSTILYENVKVDNLVHIAHGVKVGKNSVVIANAMVAGSVEIGENSWIAPSVSILNQKKVGANALIGIGAVVLKDVEQGDVVVGNPGKVIKKNV
ncbi:MAG: DapH/DapD/GlmU-related protein [Bacteroidota bacterium]